MNTTIKLKSILCSIFQPSNTLMIQKSMKSTNTYDNNETTNNNEYRIKREKNNESVRKSRAKNRVKLQECANHVQELKAENVNLNQQLENLQSELITLKGLFQRCFSFNLSNLAIKPSDIPTSTLYKIIMNNKDVSSANSSQYGIKMPESILNGQVNKISSTINYVQKSSNYANHQSKESLQTLATQSADSNGLNELDNFYLNQIKNASANLAKLEAATNKITTKKKTVMII